MRRRGESAGCDDDDDLIIIDLSGTHHNLMDFALLLSVIVML